MRCRSTAIVRVILGFALFAVLFPAACASAQTESVNDNLLISAKSAATWSNGATGIVQLEGPVSIDLDRTHLAADAAVIWLTPVKGAVLEEQRAEIALLGHTEVTQPEGIQQTAESQFVTAVIRGSVRITATSRRVRDLSGSDAYKQAVTFRPMDAIPSTQPVDDWLLQRPWISPPPPTSQPTPTTRPVPHFPLAFELSKAQFVKTADDTIAIVLTGDVTLSQRREDGEFFSMQADRAVLFTPLHSLRELDKSEKFKAVEDAVTGAYLEGDVRIIHTPAKGKGAEQRLMGNRVYYEFATDRAVLTQAVVHTFDLKSNTPLIIRAQTIRQLSEGEFTANKAELTTSSFATPSYSIGLQKAYVRTVDTGDARYGTYSVFTGESATLRAYHTPIFYLPYVAGTFSEKGSVLRALETKSGDRYGVGVVTQWGLFETLGKIPPPDTDITYELDYFGKRGPGAGINGRYANGFVTENTREPWSFFGDFQSFILADHGTDVLARRRPDVDPEQPIRGRVLWQHQHFLPDDWTVQLKADYISDPTFLEEFFPNEYYDERPHETSIYVKHQKDTESLTFLTSVQPMNFVSSADQVQEQFEVQRLPELGYHRIGDSLAGDSLTFFSDNTLSGLEFHTSHATLARQGFAPGQTPGFAATGLTGIPGEVVARGDFRQEVDAPFSFGQFRVVPYVEGRYTLYSDSPDGSSKNRLYAGAGVRVTTAFWKVDDTVVSDLFDLHRLRHVIEPEVHLFTSAQNIDRSKLFDYDEQIDAINDVTGAQLALRQRWQTKRGGPGRWRSVDFLSLNVEGNFYTNKPSDRFLQPTDFRGLFFDSIPEASIPRNSVNADANWRISDETALLADAQYNLDQHTLATASIGLAVQRDERIGYFLGTRYIKEFNSNIITAALNYQLTAKYTISARQSFDLGQRHSVTSDFTVLRHFDRFYVGLTLRYDYVANESGFLFNIYPEGFGLASSSRLQGVFTR